MRHIFHPWDLVPLVAACFTAGFLLGVAVSHQPARASDNGIRKAPEGDLPLPPTAGCNPYTVIHPPELPPAAQNMNGVTIHIYMGGVCNRPASKPEIVPSVPTPRA